MEALEDALIPNFVASVLPFTAYNDIVATEIIISNLRNLFICFPLLLKQHLNGAI
jgi:hypothetical protein